MPDVLSLRDLSQNVVYAHQLHNQDALMGIRIVKWYIYLRNNLPKSLHGYALQTLKNSYQTLVIQPFKEQIKQQQTQYTNYYSADDLTSELSTKLALKELEDFKPLYWLARACDFQDIVSFIKTKTEKENCPWIFSLDARDAVVSKIAELGDQENINKLLGLAANDSERISMLNSCIWGACKGGQITILRNIFEEKCQTEEDKTKCQSYLTADPHLFNNVCASGNLDCLDFILERIPEAEHKKIISAVDWGYRYAALREACGSGNTQVVDRLVKPFSQEEIDRIFLPTAEETNNSLSPLSYTSILSRDSVKINQHILTKVVSSECREKILTSETFVKSLAQRSLDEKRSITQVSQPESKSRLADSQFFSRTSSCSTENIQSMSITRLNTSSFFTSQETEETEKDKKEKQRCQESRLTKNN